MEYDDSKREKLNKLENKLYSRNTPDIIDKGRTEFKEEGRIDEPLSSRMIEEIKQAREGSSGWQNMKNNSFDELASRMAHVAQNKHTFLGKIFIASLVFFVLAAGVAAFIFFGGVNSVSSKNVDIKIVGPLSIGAGQEGSYDINIINSNKVDLQSASLLLEYPEGTRSPADLSKELDRERFDLKTIKSGESYNQNIKLVFFGEKDSVKQMKISLEYRVENSSALFYKEKLHEISISSAPVIITPTYPKEVNSNQEVSFNIEVASNSEDKLSNFLVKVEYPFGFTFKEASPKASYTNNIWKFENLAPGEKKTIKITGNIVGQDNEERVFHINAGTMSPDDERLIGVNLTELTESILVKKPFVGIDTSINGKSGNATVPGGREANTELLVRNNLPSRLFNISVTVSFKGGAFNPLSVIPGNDGFFQSSNNTILWDKRGVAEFADMPPGSEKKLSFRLSPLLYSNIQPGAKPEIEMTVKVNSERILESGSVDQVVVEETSKIILSTDVSLSAKTVRSIGNLENSGPMPPKVNTPSTYTILWSINNSLNQVSNVEVWATLPSYVKWTNLKNPANESFSFNEVTKEVVWNVGSILPNTGFSSPKKEIYFQLEFLPSSSQIGQAPYIVGEARLTGIDKVTGAKVEAGAPAATINFLGDPSFRTGDDKVVQ